MRLLVVEDERDLATTLQRGLTAEGYVVDVAHDGHLGLQLAMTDVYSVIVLDLMLPLLNGYRVCEQLRSAGVHTPVLILTAKDGEYDQTDALDGGADDFLSKPFSYPILLARLRALLRRASGDGTAGTDRQLCVGDLVLDQRRRSCHRAGEPITLTAREFALLEVLAQHPAHPVTKQEILLEAWPGEVDDVNLVEVRVSALRRKIDQPFGRQSLQTVRGTGYRLVDDR